MKTAQQIWSENGLNPTDYSSAAFRAMEEYANQFKSPPIVETDKLKKEIDSLSDNFIKSYFYPDIQAKGECEETGNMKNFVKNWLVSQIKIISTLISVSKEVEVSDLPKDYKEVTGFNNPNELAAYEKGRSDEQTVMANFVIKYDGHTNSAMGGLLMNMVERINNKNKEVEVSDEEIDESYPKDAGYDSLEKDAWIEGAKRMRDKQGIAPCKEVEEKCIAFAEWILENGVAENGKDWWQNSRNFTTKELFKQFIKGE